MMDDYQKTGIVSILKDAVSFNVAMSAYSTFRVGGKAEAVCFVHELSVLSELISFMDSETMPWVVIGKGSNLLFTDRGINGAVIILKGELAEVQKEENNVFTAGGGISTERLLKYCVQQELSGMEFMAGIPGTLGGAVIMNAGAHGEEIEKRIVKIGIVSQSGKTGEMDRSQISFDYRMASIPEKSVIYEISLELERGEKELIREKIRNYINKRRETQPLDMPSCGSVFKNPEGDYAGRLIEQCGLKGKHIGDAVVSSKHANFIVNTGKAKASEILELIEYVKKEVWDKTGVMLEPEIRIIGA
ncbi:UDP-N-acetylmuramate dehydrogenase [Thermodesulfobacteriota bacterium]